MLALRQHYSIALVKNEIRIVQASLLGSILSNLLLILGMCFLLGGLRFREQIYNSTVTQMSACLLSLSVMSLLLPTAFHASFTDNIIADRAVLKVSRGTSVILLLVYVLYLLFQLKSHAYMYESVPQHRIDEESHPGVLANIMGPSSSSDSSSSSGSSDSDGTSGSNTTAKRIKRVIRKGKRRRKSSSSSKDTPPSSPPARTTSSASNARVLEHSPVTLTHGSSIDRAGLPGLDVGAIASGDEADTDGDRGKRASHHQDPAVISRDFEQTSSTLVGKKKHKKMHKKHHRHKDSEKEKESVVLNGDSSSIAVNGVTTAVVEEPRSVNVADPTQSPRRPFNIRNLSLRPALPRAFATPPSAQGRVPGVAGATPPALVGRAPFGIRRTSSLPDRLNEATTMTGLQSQNQMPYVVPVNVSQLSLDSKDGKNSNKHISKTTAVILLLVSTALVAVCAEFLLGSIDYLVDNTNISEAFVGLIILPIVGNAAEHVCAVTVASKNKMDLAIGVAVGSSIQMALFVTPVIVLLGWALNKEMSLYFSLFETVSLFVSAFIVNFLVLDGRSNYLEGALLCAAYVIIAVAAFFYPDSSQQSSIGGSTPDVRMF
ncbi:MAG: hypothetical protein M1825_000592 [Sarcosagium campestre]|nr:MAG: hypothetical protein M1825_000592 [Sarcosagium campestre]